MKKRFKKAAPELFSWSLLLLSLLSLLFGLLLVPERAQRSPKEGTDSETVPPGRADQETRAEERVSPDALRDAFDRAEGCSYRSLSLPGDSTVELEAWGTPEELLFSLYAVAASRDLLRFRLGREESTYRLTLELKDE